VEGLSTGNVQKIMKAGHDTVEKIVGLSIKDLLKVEGFQIKTATKIHDGIQEKLEKASLVTLMSASNLFGRGFSEKRIELILEGVPDILTSGESVSQKIQRVSQIKGMGEKSAEAFIMNIEGFLAFLQDMGIKVPKQNPKQFEEEEKEEENHELFQRTIVLSGTREKEILEKLKSVGAKVGANITKNTFCLVVKDKMDKTGKYQDAEKYGIPIVDVGEFQKKYM